MVTETAKADEDFGVSGIVIGPCFMMDPTPPIRPEADAQLTPPAAPTLVCSRRRETMTPASLRRRGIFRLLDPLERERPVDGASLKLIRKRCENSPVIHGSLIRVPPTTTAGQSQPPANPARRKPLAR